VDNLSVLAAIFVNPPKALGEDGIVIGLAKACWTAKGVLSINVITAAGRKTRRERMAGISKRNGIKRSVKKVCRY
jgi:hypothetical protein